VWDLQELQAFQAFQEYHQDPAFLELRVALQQDSCGEAYLPYQEGQACLAAFAAGGDYPRLQREHLNCLIFFHQSLPEVAVVAVAQAPVRLGIAAAAAAVVAAADE